MMIFSGFYLICVAALKKSFKPTRRKHTFAFNVLTLIFSLFENFFYFTVLLLHVFINTEWLHVNYIFSIYAKHLTPSICLYFQRYTWPPYWGWGPYLFYLSSSSSMFSTHQSRNPSRSGPDDLSRFSWKYFAGKVPAAIWNPIKQKPLKRLPSLNSPKRLPWRQ